MATANIVVFDKQNEDGSWTGVASLWNIAVPFAIADKELINLMLAALKTSHPLSEFRAVLKTRTETQQEVVVEA
jgi:hypothetical protein